MSSLSSFFFLPEIILLPFPFISRRSAFREVRVSSRKCSSFQSGIANLFLLPRLGSNWHIAYYWTGTRQVQFSYRPRFNSAIVFVSNHPPFERSGHLPRDSILCVELPILKLSSQCEINHNHHQCIKGARGKIGGEKKRTASSLRPFSSALSFSLPGEMT